MLGKLSEETKAGLEDFIKECGDYHTLYRELDQKYGTITVPRNATAEDIVLIAQALLEMDMS